MLDAVEVARAGLQSAATLLSKAPSVDQALRLIISQKPKPWQTLTVTSAGLHVHYLALAIWGSDFREQNVSRSTQPKTEGCWETTGFLDHVQLLQTGEHVKVGIVKEPGIRLSLRRAAGDPWYR